MFYICSTWRVRVVFSESKRFLDDDKVEAIRTKGISVGDEKSVVGTWPRNLVNHSGSGRLKTDTEFLISLVELFSVLHKLVGSLKKREWGREQNWRRSKWEIGAFVGTNQLQWGRFWLQWNQRLLFLLPGILLGSLHSLSPSLLLLSPFKFFKEKIPNPRNNNKMLTRETLYTTWDFGWVELLSLFKW